MSKTAFTPGPWEYTRQVGISHGISVAGEDRGKPETFGTIAKAGSAANARLIAAAPELYEALEHSMQFVLAWIYEYRDKTDEHSRGQLKLAHIARDKIASALAKARGEP